MLNLAFIVIRRRKGTYSYSLETEQLITERGEVDKFSGKFKKALRLQECRNG